MRTLWKSFLCLGIFGLLACRSSQTSPPPATPSNNSSQSQGGTSSGGLPWAGDFCPSSTTNSIMVLGLHGGSTFWGGVQTGLVCQFGFGQIELFTLDDILYRGKTTQATTALLNSDTEANIAQYGWSDKFRAAKYCHLTGGKSQKYALAYRPDNSITLCTFPDGSIIEAWTLFYGRTAKTWST